jgi:RND superfamily putative drug exporter
VTARQCQPGPAGLPLKKAPATSICRPVNIRRRFGNEIHIGSKIYRFRWLIVIAWLVVAGALAALAPRPDPDVGETADLLPSDTPVHQTLAALADHFGDRAGLSNVVVVVERTDGPLSAGDLQQVEALGADVAKLTKTDLDLRSAAVRTPAALAATGDANPLLSHDGHAALVTVSLPFNFITKPAGRVAKQLQAMVAAHAWPAGVSATVTGSAGYGYDYAIATERSHLRTSIVTIVSVVLILLVVYRAPIAAAVPLIGISLAAAVVFKFLAIAERWGLHGGTAEQIFTFVLLYGAGVDYALLLISRYRERLEDGLPWRDALAKGVDGSVGAIFASASMTICGLAMLCLTRFSVFRFAGPAVVLALAVAAVAAATLVPALLAIAGPRTFSPNGIRPVYVLHRRPRRVWPRVAAVVVDRPWRVMAFALLALLVPAIRGGWITWDYNSLASLRQNYPAPRGSAIVARHWGPGETAPVTLLLLADAPRAKAAWDDVCRRMVLAASAAGDVENVRALTAPLGLHVTAARTATVRLLGGDRVNAEYLSPDGRAMRATVVLSVQPLSLPAMAAVDRGATAAREAVAASRFPGTVQLAGSTAEMMDLRAITRADFRRMSVLALAAILAVVALVLRDALLSAFIVGITLLSYFTALGLTFWTFHLLTGSPGLEWKVQMLLFIVLVAVGQDYSIFFAARFAQEARVYPTVEATRRAMVATGPVISSCGLIMAATLGSIMTADIAMLVQLGFAFVVGMLIDTFVVRPLLLPAFIILTRRTLSGAKLLRHG